jgi:hypothetical protein
LLIAAATATQAAVTPSASGAISCLLISRPSQEAAYRGFV